jgi:uncharacterized protein YkuJ
MGFDVNRFKVEPSLEMVCSICRGVLLDPVQRPDCEHYFCRNCITLWIELQPVCAVDRQPLTLSDLTSIPRPFKSLLGNLQIGCNFKHFGCELYVTLDHLAAHVKECHFNPLAINPCEVGCGAMINGDQRTSHSCISHLNGIIKSHEQWQKEMSTTLEAERLEKQGAVNEVNILRSEKQLLTRENTELRDQVHQTQLQVPGKRIQDQQMVNVKQDHTLDAADPSTALSKEQKEQKIAPEPRTGTVWSGCLKFQEQDGGDEDIHRTTGFDVVGYTLCCSVSPTAVNGKVVTRNWPPKLYLNLIRRQKLDPLLPSILQSDYVIIQFNATQANVGSRFMGIKRLYELMSKDLIGYFQLERVFESNTTVVVTVIVVLDPDSLQFKGYIPSDMAKSNVINEMIKENN